MLKVFSSGHWSSVRLRAFLYFILCLPKCTLPRMPIDLCTPLLREPHPLWCRCKNCTLRWEIRHVRERVWSTRIHILFIRGNEASKRIFKSSLLASNPPPVLQEQHLQCQLVIRANISIMFTVYRWTKNARKLAYLLLAKLLADLNASCVDI